jgi:hypothetical protein
MTDEFLDALRRDVERRVLAQLERNAHAGHPIPRVKAVEMATAQQRERLLEPISKLLQQDA